MKSNDLDGFRPEFFVESLPHDLLRIGFSASGGLFRCRSRVVTVRVGENWAISVRAQASLVFPASFLVMLDVRRLDGELESATDSLTFEVGTLVPAGGEPLDAVDVCDLEPEMTAALQRAFFEAHGWPIGQRIDGDAEMEKTLPHFLRRKPAKPTTAGVGRNWRGLLPGKRTAVAAALLVGAGLVGYGLMAPKTPQDPLQAASGSDYAEMRERIRKEIVAAANSKNSAYGGLEGQNVTIATLKAMGLDPGKANTGCLVGVK